MLKFAYLFLLFLLFLSSCESPISGLGVTQDNFCAHSRDEVNDCPLLNDAGPSMTAIQDQVTFEGTAVEVSWTVKNSEFIENCLGSFSFTSGNQSLVPSGAIQWGGIYPECKATITPNLGVSGSTELTINLLKDGQVKANEKFKINISPKTLVLSGGGYQFLDSTYAKSCLHYRKAAGYVSEGSGYYWIDPDGTDGSAEILSYCDMIRDGGGWTLLSNRRGGTVNVESCGANLNTFFQGTCGDVLNIGFSQSYNIGGELLRTQLNENHEWLFAQYTSTGIEDSDDAYIIHSENDLFFPSLDITNAISVEKVCDVNNQNCDTTDVFFLWVGNGWFANSLCGTAYQTGSLLGNYGYCHDGLNGIQSNSLFGNRSAYNETKLWNYASGGTSFQERIYIR